MLYTKYSVYVYSHKYGGLRNFNLNSTNNTVCWNRNLCNVKFGFELCLELGFYLVCSLSSCLSLLLPTSLYFYLVRPASPLLFFVCQIMYFPICFLLTFIPVYIALSLSFHLIFQPLYFILLCFSCPCFFRFLSFTNPLEK